jgi:hypothetical protein
LAAVGCSVLLGLGVVANITINTMVNSAESAAATRSGVPPRAAAKTDIPKQTAVVMEAITHVWSGMGAEKVVRPVELDVSLAGKTFGR